jgi:tRNA(adenine34) deaminase
MCAGALVQSRIDRVVIGAPSFKSGCGGTLLNILQNNEFNHQVEVDTGLMQEQCTEILRRFFKDLRMRNKIRKKSAAEAAQARQSESFD